MSNSSFKVQDVINEANEILEKARKKNAKELSMAVVRPLDKQYPFSTNGIYLFCGKIGSGKSYEVMKHILITELFFCSINSEIFNTRASPRARGSKVKICQNFENVNE